VDETPCDRRCSSAKKNACVFSEIATVGSNVTFFGESGTQRPAEVPRQARNSFGDSVYSNGVSVKLK